jgi:predicted DsbA family dithiol-disulfide isomerase
LSPALKVDVYFDYACPYVNAAAKWVAELEKQLGADQVEFNWRFFPLEQVNAPADIEDKVWDLPPENRSQARNSMHAALAAMQQGDDAFSRFHLALLTMKHDEGMDHGKKATIEEAARRAELDLDKFQADSADRTLLTRIRDDYEQGRETLGIFGTPTFVFPDGETAYLQVLPPPPAEDAVPFWNDFVHDVVDRPYLREIKRPRRPA